MRRVTAHCSEGIREAGIGSKRVSSNALFSVSVLPLLLLLLWGYECPYAVSA